MTGFIKTHTASGGGERKSVQKGEHDGLLHAIIDYGLQKQEFKGEEKAPKNVVKIVFDVPGEGLIGLGELPTSLHEKSNFVKTFKNLGVATIEELEELFATEESVLGLIGLPVRLIVDEFQKEDKTTTTYISSIARLDKRLPAPESDLQGFVFSFSNPDLDIFKNKVTGYGRKRIMSALNAKDLPREFHEAYMAELDEVKSREKAVAGKKKASITGK